MGTRTTPTDEELLASHDTQAFGTFYDRHARTLLGYFARRTGDPQVAADLTAETFASAIVAQERYVPTGAPALAWLYAIAGRRLADYQRRGAVDRRTQRALAMERVRVGEDDAAMIRLLADDAALAMLAELPPEQREAVMAHVVDDRGYPELAATLDTSEAAVRQRVSRGLATLRDGEGADERHPHRAAARGRRRARDAPASLGALRPRCAAGGRCSRARPRSRPSLVAVVVAVGSLPAPEPTSEPHVVEVLRIGGIPVDGVLAGGALWVADSERSEVVRIDPDTRRVVARIRVTGNIEDIAAGEDGLWVRAGGRHGLDSRLSRIDPRSNRVVAGVASPAGLPAGRRRRSGLGRPPARATGGDRADRRRQRQGHAPHPPP